MLDCFKHLALHMKRIIGFFDNLKFFPLTVWNALVNVSLLAFGYRLIISYVNGLRTATIEDEGKICL